MPTEQKMKRLQAVAAKLWYIAQVALLIWSSLIVAGGLGRLANFPGILIFYVSLALVLVGWTFIVVVHELGHAFAASIYGWKIAVVAVGRLTIRPAQRRLHYGLSAFPGLGGAILPIPPEAGNWRKSYVIMLLGGPIANLVLAVCFAAGVLICSESPFWTHYLGVMAGLSGLTCAVNLLPVSKGLQKFDGARIAMALRGENLESWARLARLSAELVTPKRPRDWNPECVAAARDDYASGGSEGALGLMLCAYHLDCGDLEKARAALAWAGERLGELDNVKISKAFILAYFDKDIEGAENLLAQVKSRALKLRPAYLISRAVIARHTNDQQFASIVDRARASLKRSPFTTPADLDFLEGLAGKSSESIVADAAAVAS